MAKVTKNKLEYDTKWKAENLYRTNVLFPKERETQIREAANGNLNGFIVAAVQEFIEDCEHDKG